MKPRKREKEAAAERHEHVTEFTRILERLLALEPTALAAVLVDGDGEAVDYAGVLSAFHTKVAGAHFRIVLEQMGAFAPSGGTAARARSPLRQLVVRGFRRTFLARPLSDGYALVLVLKRHGFGASDRALAVAERALSVEAGWPVPETKGPTWHPVHIETVPRDRRRPLRIEIGSIWHGVEVLGSIVGLGRECGYRCRLRSGVELTLVREPVGTWYADEPVEEVTGDERDHDRLAPRAWTTERKARAAAKIK
jgi:hypothetical protein